MENILEIKNLSKKYKGFELKNVNIELPKEKISKEYSSGMKMKLKIAVALAHHPK